MLPAGTAGPEGCRGDLIFQITQVNPGTGLHRIYGNEPIPASVFGAKWTLPDPLDRSAPLPGELFAGLAPDLHQGGSEPWFALVDRGSRGYFASGEGENAAFKAIPLGLQAEYVEQSAYDPFALHGTLAR